MLPAALGDNVLKPPGARLVWIKDDAIAGAVQGVLQGTSHFQSLRGPHPQIPRAVRRKTEARSFSGSGALTGGGAQEQGILAIASRDLPKGGGNPRSLSQSFHWTPCQTSHPQSIRQSRILAPPSVSGHGEGSSGMPALSHPSRVPSLRAGLSLLHL